jgi:hypothetical protein
VRYDRRPRPYEDDLPAEDDDEDDMMAASIFWRLGMDMAKVSNTKLARDDVITPVTPYYMENLESAVRKGIVVPLRLVQGARTMAYKPPQLTGLLAAK